MYWEACDISEIDAKERGVSKGSTYSKVMKTIDDFLQSGFECAEVKDYGHKSSRICGHSLLNATKRLCTNTVKVIVRGKRVFLVRKEN